MKMLLDTANLNELTDRGLAGFLNDWEKARGVLGDSIAPAAARQAGR